jgi:hypothetical protein
MSSPSPGKRRMDTDVVKLYPSWRESSGCVWGRCGGARDTPEIQARALGHSRPQFETPVPPPVPKADPWHLPGAEGLLAPFYLQHPEICALSARPELVTFPARRVDSQDGLFFFFFFLAGLAAPLLTTEPIFRVSASCLLALDLGTQGRNSREGSLSPF